MHITSICRYKSAVLAVATIFLPSFHAVAEDLLKEDFKDSARAEMRWTLSPDTGKASFSESQIQLSGTGFPSARSNQSSNFNDDGAKPVTYSMDYSIEAGQFIFWVRMDELGIPSGSVLLQGGSNAVQGYRIDIAPSSGKGRVALSRHLAGQPGIILWQNDPGVGSGISLQDGTIKVELINEETSVVINVSINGKDFASWVDDSPDRIQSGVGVGVSAFDDNGDAAATIKSLDVSR